MFPDFKSFPYFLKIAVALHMMLICCSSAIASDDIEDDPRAQALQEKRLKWCRAAIKTQFPTYELTGCVKGFQFHLSRATFFKDQGYLMLEDTMHEAEGPGAIGIRLWTKKKLPAGKTFVVPKSQKRNPVIEIQYIRQKKVYKTVRVRANAGYGMRLHFGKVQGKKMPVFIVLRLPYSNKSYLQGYFVARIR